MLTNSNMGGGSLKLNCLKKKGFTLIELLAVIVILAIIAVIATPIITGIIEDSKKASFERSVEGIVDATRFDITNRLTEEGYTYEFENGNIDLGANVKVSNAKNLSGTIKYNSEGEVSYAIHNDKWCVVKDGESKTTNLYNGECSLGGTDTPTAESCFAYAPVTKVISFDEDTCNICNGEVDSIFDYFSQYYSLKDEINACRVVEGDDGNYQYVCDKDYISLEAQGTIKNVVKVYGVGIYNYKGISFNELENIVIESFEVGDNCSEHFDSDCTVEYLTERMAENSNYKADFIRDNVIKNVKFSGEYSECGQDVIIPSTIDGKPVISIDGEAFSNNLLNSVVIPDGVLSIGYIYENGDPEQLDVGPFSRSSIKEIKIPDSVTIIGDGTFAGNQLTSVTLPKNLIRIGYGAFSSNQLTNVTIPDSVVGIRGGAFSDNQLTSVTLSSNLKIIEFGGAFSENQLTSVVIPDGVKSIGAYAFAENQLTSVKIPDGVVEILHRAFNDNQLTSVTIPSSVVLLEPAFQNNQLPDSEAFIYKRNDDGTIDNTTLVSYGGAKRDNIIIPNGVTSIEAEAFSGNQLTSIIIPNSVTSIGYGAFSGNQLTNVTIPDSVTSIGENAFDKVFGNYNLTKIINKTGKSFDWGSIINGSSGYEFVTGTVVNKYYGNVEITSE